MLTIRNRALPEHETYKTWVGFIFIFNLIVGTGALTLPSVFAKAGWGLSLVFIIFIGFISYVTITFLVECMACANAVKKWQVLQFATESAKEEEDDCLLPQSQDQQDSDYENTDFYYRLDEKFELGDMAIVFFNDIGRIFFYLCVAIYLYGDLSIYMAAIAKSLRDVTCESGNSSSSASSVTFSNSLLNFNSNDTITECWQNHTMTRLSVYRLYLIGFALVFGPLAAFSLQKTKFLQMLTVVFRWLAFILMIGISIKLLLTDGVKGHPVIANIYSLPALFGACLYSFMCHHSLPGILVPIRDKSNIKTVIAWDFITICCFYIILSLTGIFAFDHINDLFTLNFIPINNHDHNWKSELLVIIDYFLALFPVFTLSTSFPIIAITLKNNLQIIFLDMTRFDSYNYFIRRIIFPLATIIPPFAITYFTQNLISLVTFTGYTGAGIQYIIPICLTFFARRTCNELLGNGIVNRFKSPFHGMGWLVFVLFWAIICICLVTINIL